MNAFRIGVVLVLAVAVAVLANLVLLGVATGPRDPVGDLSPRAGLIRLPATAPTAPSIPKGKTTSGEESGHGQDD